MNSQKIKPSHLARAAYVYVRQSTDRQVQTNLQSQQRQYELADIARRFGWTRESVVTIDDDLGRSGSSAAGRTGFAQLVADVVLGKAGIIFGLEVSRLARNNRDWYQLLDICSMTGTLIADADGVYDPAHFNDRLLLGLKGTMSEAELHVLKGRMLAGLQHKASKGELRYHLVAGYQYDDGRIVKSHDEQIVHMIELVFSRFFEIGSVNGLLKVLLEEGLELPRKAAVDKAVRWVRPYYKAVHDTLTNPIYAGAYVYGKSKIRQIPDENGGRKSRQTRRDMQDWEVLIRDHHPAYVAWDDFLRIRKMIESNQRVSTDQASRVAREGGALLQGLVRCGKCGRAMQVRYPGKIGKTYHNYVCSGAMRFGGSLCQAMGGRRIDEAVTHLFLGEMAPARLGLHLEAVRQIEARTDNVAKQLELELERAEYEAKRAERQFAAVEPENRLVARTVETRWNEALTHAVEVKERLAERRRQMARRLNGTEAEEIRGLAADLGAIWAAKTTTDKERKQLLRTVLDEVQIRKEERDVQLKILWKGGALIEKTVHLPRVPARTDATHDLIALLRELAVRHTDEQIARILNRKGIKTPKGLSFNAHRAANLRLNHGIDCYRQTNDQQEETYTVEQAAGILDVGTQTIYLWIKAGILKADQVTSSAPWVVYVTDDDKHRLTAQAAPAGWLPIDAAAHDLGVSKQTVANWVKEGKVGYVYVTKGRRRGLRIDVNSVSCRSQPCLFS